MQLILRQHFNQWGYYKMKFLNKVKAETGKDLRAAKVTFSDGNEITTSLAAHLTDDEIRNYFKIGKEFNIGLVEDNVVKVVKVEILK